MIRAKRVGVVVTRIRPLSGESVEDRYHVWLRCRRVAERIRDERRSALYAAGRLVAPTTFEAANRDRHASRIAILTARLERVIDIRDEADVVIDCETGGFVD